MTESEREGWRKVFQKERIGMMNSAYRRTCVCGHDYSWHTDWRKESNHKCWMKQCKCRKFTRAFGYRMVADAFVMGLIEDIKQVDKRLGMM